MLSDRDIKHALAQGRITITPDDGVLSRLGPASVDLWLGRTFLVFERTNHAYIDTRRPQTAAGTTRTITLDPEEPFIIHPGALVLSGTLERLRLADNLAGRLEGRSSLGRLGIIVHSTASLFHPGWDGHATMELGNLGIMPVALYAGMRICAFTFDELQSPAERPYGLDAGPKYAGQEQALPSRICDEADGDLP